MLGCSEECANKGDHMQMMKDARKPSSPLYGGSELRKTARAYVESAANLEYLRNEVERPRRAGEPIEPDGNF